MAEFNDDLENEIRRQVEEQLNHTLAIPDGLSEDEAVTAAIEQYKALTGIELPEADVRTEVCKKMDGRKTT